jgi:hypothetical protein
VTFSQITLAAICLKIKHDLFVNPDLVINKRRKVNSELSILDHNEVVQCRDFFLGRNIRNLDEKRKFSYPRETLIPAKNIRLDLNSNYNVHKKVCIMYISNSSVRPNQTQTSS